MLTESALQSYLKHTKRTIASAKYKIGSTYYEAEIDRIVMLENAPSTMEVYLVISPPVNTEVEISEVCLYDTSGNLFLKNVEKEGKRLKINPLQEGGIYVLTFEFEDKEVE